MKTLCLNGQVPFYNYHIGFFTFHNRPECYDHCRTSHEPQTRCIKVFNLSLVWLMGDLLLEQTVLPGWFQYWTTQPLPNKTSSTHAQQISQKHHARCDCIPRKRKMHRTIIIMKHVYANNRPASANQETIGALSEASYHKLNGGA